MADASVTGTGQGRVLSRRSQSSNRGRQGGMQLHLGPRGVKNLCGNLTRVSDAPRPMTVRFVMTARRCTAPASRPKPGQE
jgi:hypothetical protein